MFAATSVVPFVVIAGLFAVAVSFVTIPRLLRAVGASSVVADTPSPGTDIIKCGFNLVRPGRLTSSLGTCTVRVSDHELVVRTPVGDYVWTKNDARASPARVTEFALAFRVSDQTKEADVLVRDPVQITAALQRHGWATDPT